MEVLEFDRRKLIVAASVCTFDLNGIRMEIRFGLADFTTSQTVDRDKITARKDKRWFWELPKSAKEGANIDTPKNGTVGIVSEHNNSNRAKNVKDARYETGSVDPEPKADNFPELPKSLDRRLAN